MSAPLTIRDATRVDARAIAEIHVAAWRAAYRGLMPDDYLASLSVEQRTAMWQAIMGKPGPAKLALAEFDGEITGFCSFGPTRDEAPSDIAEIYAVNVHPECWRRGAGRLLCEHAFREAAEREHTAVTLWVLKGNDGARRFYERLGYAPDGAEKTDTALVGSPLHDMRYRKVIG
jgi:ribosomal protein S18 acetylase RimI-like enzyme